MEWLLLIIIIFLSSIAFASLSLIVWVPTRRRDLERILALADLKPGESFIDLGSGTGTVVFYIGRQTKNLSVGLELAFPFFLYSKIKSIFLKTNNINFFCNNLFKVSLSKYDVVYVFGIPEKLKNKLKPKLEAEMKKGSRVISYAFAIDGWEPEIISRPDTKNLPIYLYQR